MPGIVHFDIPVDDIDRARQFYQSLFAWKIEKVPGELAYYLIDTGGDETMVPEWLGGGMALRSSEGQQITLFVGVDDVESFTCTVEKLGGKIREAKTPIAGYGYLAVCEDTEGNSFGLWQDDTQAAM